VDVTCKKMSESWPRDVPTCVREKWAHLERWNERMEWMEDVHRLDRVGVMNGG
jgi:hypothetical protein